MMPCGPGRKSATGRCRSRSVRATWLRRSNTPCDIRKPLPFRRRPTINVSGGRSSRLGFAGEITAATVARLTAVVMCRDLGGRPSRRCTCEAVREPGLCSPSRLGIPARLDRRRTCFARQDFMPADAGRAHWSAPPASSLKPVPPGPCTTTCTMTTWAGALGDLCRHVANQRPDRGGNHRIARRRIRIVVREQRHMRLQPDQQVPGGMPGNRPSSSSVSNGAPDGSVERPASRPVARSGPPGVRQRSMASGQLRRVLVRHAQLREQGLQHLHRREVRIDLAVLVVEPDLDAVMPRPQHVPCCRPAASVQAKGPAARRSPAARRRRRGPRPARCPAGCASAASPAVRLRQERCRAGTGSPRSTAPRAVQTLAGGRRASWPVEALGRRRCPAEGRWAGPGERPGGCEAAAGCASARQSDTQPVSETPVSRAAYRRRRRATRYLVVAGVGRARGAQIGAPAQYQPLMHIHPEARLDAVGRHPRHVGQRRYEVPAPAGLGREFSPALWPRRGP